MAVTTAMLNKALIGEIRLFSGSVIPDNWLVCDGRALSRTTYSMLFNVIGTTYGSGDGSTTFNIPDLRGRVPLGVGESSATGHTEHTLGQAAGEETHTLDTTEIPAHKHSVSRASLAESAGGHTHNLTTKAAGGSGGSWCLQLHQGPNDNTLTTDSKGAHTHYISAHNTNDTGGGNGHNNMQPYLGLNFMIYVG